MNSKKWMTTGGIQYGGNSDEVENHFQAARGSSIYEHMVRRIVNRIRNIHVLFNNRYIIDESVPVDQRS